jgi:glutathione S-transferase
MSKLRIYGVPLSVHTRKVIVAARLKSLAHEIVPVVPVIPDDLPANWRQISPTGLIPAIDDDGFVLADSTAILVYLDRRHPEVALLQSDPRELGRALFIDAWAGAALFRAVVHPIFHNQIVAPKIRRQPGDASAIQTALDVHAPEAFAELERRDLGGFLVGERLSIADLAVMSNLIQLHYLGHGIEAKAHPALAAYFRRLLALPVLKSALAAEKPFAERMGLDTSFTE